MGERARDVMDTRLHTLRPQMTVAEAVAMIQQASEESGRKVKATLHWVSASHSHPAEVRVYDRLFHVPEPGAETGNFLDDLNPDSLEILASCRVEPSLAQAAPGARFQFERLGYFAVDLDSTPDNLIFNRTVTLKDPWAKLQKGEQK